MVIAIIIIIVVIISIIMKMWLSINSEVYIVATEVECEY